jgi:hypothetical protein
MSSKSPTPLGNSTNTGETQRRSKRQKQSNDTAATTIPDAATAAVSNAAAAGGSGGRSSTRRSQRQRAPKINQDPPSSDEEMESEEEEVSQNKNQRGGQQKKKAGGNGKKNEAGGKPSNKNSTNHSSDNHRDKLINKYRPIQEEMIENSSKNMVNFPERSNRQNNLNYYFYTEELMALKNAFDNQGDPVKKSRSKKPLKQGIHERINKICKHLSKDLKKCIMAVENETVTTLGGVPDRNKYMKEETMKLMGKFKQLAQQKHTPEKTYVKSKFYYHHCQELADAIEEEMINNMSLESDSEDRKSVLGLLAYMDEQTYQWEQSIVMTKGKKGEKESYKTMAAQVITPVVHQMTVDGINEENYDCNGNATGKSYLDLGKKGKGGPKGELAVLLHECGQEEMNEEDLDKFMEKVDAIGDKLLKNMNLKEG